MWGMEFYELMSFVRQLGFALAGGASLWGCVFLYMSSRKSIADARSVFLAWIGLRLRWVIALGSSLAFLAWLTLLMISSTSAHEGVTLITEKADVLQAMHFAAPLYIILIGIIFVILHLRNKPTSLYNQQNGFSWLYSISFIVASIGISYYTDLGNLPLHEVIFHIFHGFHSIFTLGTVLTLDFIFLSTQKAPLAQKHIFPLFPQISKVIWVGLSLDLLSTLLIYPHAIALTPRFYFAQIVVGILIINGILLSGVITRRVLKNIETGHKEESAKWELFATIAGAISITSWTAITFVDAFHNMTASLWQLFAVYIVVIVCGIVGHEIWNRLDRRAEEMH